MWTRPQLDFVVTSVILIFIGYLLAKKNFFSKSLKNFDNSIITYKQWSGVPGFFRCMGITGMPLITILVTLIFCILAMLSHAINAMFPGTIPESFPALILELSKLTLGAFIGSFVNKTVETNK